MPHVAMGTRRLGMLHRGLVLPMLLMVRRLQVMMRSRLVLRCRLKVVAVLTTMIRAAVL